MSGEKTNINCMIVTQDPVYNSIFSLPGERNSKFSKNGSSVRMVSLVRMLGLVRILQCI